MSLLDGYARDREFRTTIRSPVLKTMIEFGKAVRNFVPVGMLDHYIELRMRRHFMSYCSPGEAQNAQYPPEVVQRNIYALEGRYPGLYEMARPIIDAWRLEPLYDYNPPPPPPLPLRGLRQSQMQDFVHLVNVPIGPVTAGHNGWTVIRRWI